MYWQTRFKQPSISSSLLLVLLHLAHFLPISKATSQRYSVRTLIGVDPNSRSHYEPTQTETNFKCLDGSGIVSFDAVNDDYCDCRDASDEPGTSACPHGRFFCQNAGYIPKTIPAGWVNDGRCDCCDGSDEYNTTSISCVDDCFILGEHWRAEQEKFKVISEQGSAIRSQYKQLAKSKRENATILLEQYKRELTDRENAVKALEQDLAADFGPDSVYYPLKGECFKYTDREYVYSLCPFERAVQESQGGAHTELGRWSGWNGPANNIYSSQKYENGLQCWNGPARSTVVSVTCGVESKLVSVSEPSRCEYTFDFITPAACPDTDPPQVDIEEPALTEASSDLNEEENASLEVEEETTEGFVDENLETSVHDGNNENTRHDEL